MAKGRHIVFLGLLVCGICLLALSFRSSKTSPQWKLVWTENFKKKSLDSGVWGYMTRNSDLGKRFHSSNKNCYSLNKGGISIRAIQNTVDDTDTASFLTGAIWTKSKKAFKPGRIEVKARFNDVDGKRCAIWLLPFTPKKGWPADGEIDLMEHDSGMDYITQTVHTSYTKKNSAAMPKRYAKVNVDMDKFNIYGVDILPDKIEFYVNNKRTLTYPKVDSLSNLGQFPFYQDWFLILNTSVFHDSKKRSVSLSLDIDWIKYYELK